MDKLIRELKDENERLKQRLLRGASMLQPSDSQPSSSSPSANAEELEKLVSDQKQELAAAIRANEMHMQEVNSTWAQRLEAVRDELRAEKVNM